MNTIHSIPLFADAITREIDRDRNEIVERLRPILLVKIAGSETTTIILQPQDLQSK